MRWTRPCISRVGNNIATINWQYFSVKHQVDVKRSPFVLFLSHNLINFVIKSFKVSISGIVPVGMFQVKHFSVTIGHHTDSGNVTFARCEYPESSFMIRAYIDTAVEMIMAEFCERGGNPIACVCGPNIFCRIRSKRIELFVNGVYRIRRFWKCRFVFVF